MEKVEASSRVILSKINNCARSKYEIQHFNNQRYRTAEGKGFFEEENTS